ncbi:MAG: EpsI family protein [Gammaproteobacteria bacterium]|nr:EpsI family protein [Gammaproteobacteria bacterium]NIR90928.1 EpsI family protein [Gammaproteobacteria bacterium]NIU07114.1 EpsI family protein [Gammaproteobacteria bacterium]NIV76243.1 EpsI family protein [Gammaproteobacteria bacterium]NIX88387.1 EpsI family protein [Gammaproteobacteria bacterium]
MYPTSASHALTGVLSWPMAVTVTLLALLVLLAVFSGTSATLLSLWWNNGAYGHALLLLPISLYLVWRQRWLIAREMPRPTPWVLPLLVLWSLTWDLAYLVDVQTGQQLALLLMLPTVLWTLLGTPVMKRLAFPVGYLLLGLPVWDLLIPYLQHFAAVYSTEILRAMGVPVFLDGQRLSIPSGDFVIADVCAGLRYFLASLSIATLYAYLTYRSTWRCVVFVLVGAGLAALFNWIRVVTIVLLGHLSEMQSPLIEDHLWIGWALFSVALGPLFLFGAWLREPPKVDAKEEAVPPRSSAPGPRGLTFVGVAVAVVGAASVGPILAHAVQDRQPLADSVVISPIPAPKGWSGPFEPRIEWHPEFRGAQAELMHSYEKGGKVATVFIAYYRSERQGAELVNEQNRLYERPPWRQATAGNRYRDLMTDGGQTLRVRETRLRGSTDERLIWSWYYAHGRFLARGFATKLYQLWNRLAGRRGAAMLAVAVEVDDVGSRDRARALLEHFIASSAPPLSSALERAEPD